MNAIGRLGIIPCSTELAAPEAKADADLLLVLRSQADDKEETKTMPGGYRIRVAPSGADSA
jgi:hypothetical protein